MLYKNDLLGLNFRLKFRGEVNLYMRKQKSGTFWF